VLAYSGSPIDVVRGTVVNIHPSHDNTRINLISLKASTKDGEATADGLSTATSVETIVMSLFVDCSGSSSISAKMLPIAGVGWSPFPQHHYDPIVSYQTALITVPEHVRGAISCSVPKGDIDYGQWDHMAFIDAFHPTSETGREVYIVQKVDGDHREFIMICFSHLTMD
jgi:hypothetical protein